MAPEISTGKYNKPIDIYAIGVILFEMITGRVPFEGETVGEVLIKHLTTRPDLSKLPEPFKTIVGQALAKDPAHRQTRVVDLLPPDDAPRPRDVRFIGEGKVASPAPPPRPRPRPPEDDILRITDEEPVHYIGPDTRPPRARAASYNPWARRQPQPPPARRPAPAPPAGAGADRPDPARPAGPPDRHGPLAAARAAADPAAAPLGTDPGRRAGRVDALGGPLGGAGLASWSAALMQVDLTRRPQDLGYLFAMTLLGSWAVLAVEQVRRGERGGPDDPSGDPAHRRGGLRPLRRAPVGLDAGRAGHLGGTRRSSSPGFDQIYDAGPMPGLLGYAAYFGLVGLAVDWWTMTDRDRKSRFRLVPIVKAGLLALIPACCSSRPTRTPTPSRRWC